MAFHKNGRKLPLIDPTIISADYVSIMFENQKNGERMDTITMQCSYDMTLCPVRAWERRTISVLEIKGGAQDSYASSYVSKGKKAKVTVE